MKNVLLLTSSPRGEASLSTQIATMLAQDIFGAQVIVRDLWRVAVPHISPDFTRAVFTPHDSRTPEQVEELKLSDTFIAELKAADVIIIGAGMINFGIPSPLKSWLDHVIRARETFRYSDTGPQGLVTGKKVILVLATGGVYSDGPMTAMNYLEPYLRSVLPFIGLTDIETILVEGVAKGAEAVAPAIAAATENARTLAVAHAA